MQRDLNADFQVNAVSTVNGTYGSVAAVIDAAAEEVSIFHVKTKSCMQMLLYILSYDHTTQYLSIHV